MAWLSTRGSTSCLDKLRVAAGHGVVLEAALAALRIAAAVADGDGDHRRQLVLGDEPIERGEEQAIRTVGADDEGRLGSGHVAFGDVDGHLANVRLRMCLNPEKPNRIIGIGGRMGVGVARDAGIILAVLGVHGEFHDRSVELTIGIGQLRRGSMRGADDEVAVLRGVGDGAVGQLRCRDVSRRMGIARGRNRAAWTRSLGLGSRSGGGLAVSALGSGKNAGESKGGDAAGIWHADIVRHGAGGAEDRIATIPG